MAQETISSAILIIAAIIATVALVNAVYPSIFTAMGSVHSVSDSASDRVRTDVKVAMSSMQNSSTLFVWVKNVGSTGIPADKLPYTDVYFGDTGSMTMVEKAPEASFHWTYVLDDTSGNGNWDPGETLLVAITESPQTYLTSGTHNMKLVLYNTASIQETITI